MIQKPNNTLAQLAVVLPLACIMVSVFNLLHYAAVPGRSFSSVLTPLWLAMVNYIVIRLLISIRQSKDDDQ